MDYFIMRRNGKSSRKFILSKHVPKHMRLFVRSARFWGNQWMPMSLLLLLVHINTFGQKIYKRGIWKVEAPFFSKNGFVAPKHGKFQSMEPSSRCIYSGVNFLVIFVRITEIIKNKHSSVIYCLVTMAESTANNLREAQWVLFKIRGK